MTGAARRERRCACQDLSDASPGRVDFSPLVCGAQDAMTEGTTWYTAQPHAGYGFQLTRGTLGEHALIVEILGEFLKFGLAHVEYVEDVVRKHGFEAAAAYLAERSFAERVSTRVGDFGEVIAGRLLEAEEGLVRPVEKARYKDDHNWSMRLTDVFCTREEAGEIAGFVFCEAKAGTTRPPGDLAVRAYRRLVVDSEEERPEILFFTLEHLLAQGKYAEHERLDDAMRRREPVPRAMRMVLVFDADSWDDAVLDGLEEARGSGDVGELDDFMSYLLTRAELRPLIEASYEFAGRVGGR